MAAEVKHPADEIGKALARATGILTLLSSCYDKQSQSFETGGGYAFESILAIEAILGHAASALGKLYETCDLTLLQPQQSEPLPQEVSASTQVANLPPAQEIPVFEGYLGRSVQMRRAESANLNGYLSSFGPPEQGGRLSERADSALSRSFGLEAPVSRVPLSDRRAEDYDELLQKLTAVANQAAVMEDHPDLGQNLAPALEELRADLIRLRSVA